MFLCVEALRLYSCSTQGGCTPSRRTNMFLICFDIVFTRSGFSHTDRMKYLVLTRPAGMLVSAEETVFRIPRPHSVFKSMDIIDIHVFDCQPVKPHGGPGSSVLILILLISISYGCHGSKSSLPPLRRSHQRAESNCFGLSSEMPCSAIQNQADRPTRLNSPKC